MEYFIFQLFFIHKYIHSYMHEKVLVMGWFFRRWKWTHWNEFRYWISRFLFTLILSSARNKLWGRLGFLTSQLQQIKEKKKSKFKHVWFHLKIYQILKPTGVKGYTFAHLSLSLSLYICIYIYIKMPTHSHIYIHE